MSDVFALQVAAFAAKAKANADLVVRKVVFEVGASVVKKSPVDTGRFRANWQHSVGQPDVTTTDTTDTSEDGTETAGLLFASIAQAPTAQVHYLTNSLPYAIPLENGHSKQAPQGMCALTVVEFQTFIDKAVQEIKT